MSAPVAAQRVQRADARRNREQIVAAAKDVFAELGTDAPMEEVARRSDVGVGTLYRHFPTKRALMGELLAQRFRIFLATAREARDSIDDPWEAFAGVLMANAEYASGDVALQGALSRDEVPWDAAAEPLAELQEVFSEIIARGQRAGAIRPDLRITDIPVIMCGVCATMGNRRPDGEAMDWRRFLELMLDGARPRPSS